MFSPLTMPHLQLIRGCERHYANYVKQIKADRTETGKDTKQQIKELQEEAKKVAGK